METNLILSQVPHSELPAPQPELPVYDVSVKVTQCENRFEILAKPGAQLDSWALQAVLAKWIDSRKVQGHNPPNFIAEA